MTSPTIHELGERLGLVFRDPGAIDKAFVHASYMKTRIWSMATTSASSFWATRSSA